MRLLKCCILSMTLAAAAANAQIRLPVLPLPTLPVQTLPQTLGQIQGQTADQLSALRRLEVARLIRANRRVVDTDQNGDPIVRNEILGLSPADAAVDGARAAGFTVDREQVIGPLNISVCLLPAQVSTVASAVSVVGEPMTAVPLEPFMVMLPSAAVFVSARMPLVTVVSPL